MKKYIILLTAFILFISANGQENEPKTLIMGVPQYLIIDGLRIDFDFKRKTNQWLTISPIVYLKNNEKNFSKEYNSDNNSIIGGGLGILFKEFLLNKPGPKGIYFAYGPLYQYNKINTTGNYWIDVNLEKHETEGLYATQIHKAGANCTIGGQFKIAENLFGDIYLGFGVRYSFLIHNNGEGSRFNSSWIDHGYSGILLVSGIRIGIGM
ncbi:MAG: hypothetical protein JXB17_10085 [Bacteroidales bacterium]|nr:hypothetical protein [Bacteroidales bacterium]